MIFLIEEQSFFLRDKVYYWERTYVLQKKAPKAGAIIFLELMRNG